MGTPGTLLVGIACVLAHSNSPESGKIRESLTQEESKLIEQLQEGPLCAQLDQYIKDGKKIDESVAVACQSCLKTTTALKSKPDAK